jgi:hypothetical protein
VRLPSRSGWSPAGTEPGEDLTRPLYLPRHCLLPRRRARRTVLAVVVRFAQEAERLRGSRHRTLFRGWISALTTGPCSSTFCRGSMAGQAATRLEQQGRLPVEPAPGIAGAAGQISWTSASRQTIRQPLGLKVPALAEGVLYPRCEGSRIPRFGLLQPNRRLQRVPLVSRLGRAASATSRAPLQDGSGPSVSCPGPGSEMPGSSGAGCRGRINRFTGTPVTRTGNACSSS